MKLGLLILLGIPGSGKTTWAKNFMQHNIMYNLVHLCYDEMIPYCKTNNNPETKTWKEARTRIIKKIEHLIFCIKNNYFTNLSDFNEIGKMDENKITILLIDDNMYYRSMRYCLFQLAREHQIGFCQMYFKCELETALKMNLKRDVDQQVPQEIITSMYEKIEPPSENYNWEKYSITYKSFHNDNSINEALLDILEESLRYPPTVILNKKEEKEASKVISSSNLVHQVDLILRELVGEKMKNMKENGSPIERKKYFNICNESRVRILADIKSNKLLIPDNILLWFTHGQKEVKDELRSFLQQKFQLS